MQQERNWDDLLQPNSFIAFIGTSDDDGDDPDWRCEDGEIQDNTCATPGDGVNFDDSQTDDCADGNGLDYTAIVDSTPNNVCLYNDALSPDVTTGSMYTSMAFDINPGAGCNNGSDGVDNVCDDEGDERLGFTTFMSDFYPALAPEVDWAFYATIASTGESVLTGGDDAYEFDCGPGTAQNPFTVETGDEYVKLAQYTNTQDQMIRTCDTDWPLDQLASDIVSSIPNDTYVLTGGGGQTCGQINPATITVLVNGIPLQAADWNYDVGTCTVTITNNIPVIGDNVVIVYENV
jgi:hypothetical protein